MMAENDVEPVIAAVEFTSYTDIEHVESFMLMFEQRWNREPELQLHEGTHPHLRYRLGTVDHDRDY